MARVGRIATDLGALADRGSGSRTLLVLVDRDPRCMATTNGTTTLHTYLGYRDAPAALRWLQDALGFEISMEVPDGTGGIAHSELRRGDAALVVFTDADGYDRPAAKGETVGHGVYLAVPGVDDVEAAWTAALAAGATEVWPPAATEWNHRCRVRDAEGREWTVGTHRPGATSA